MLHTAPVVSRLPQLARSPVAPPPPAPAPAAPSVPRATAGGELLTPEEVARRLGVSEKALERWRGSGAGPAFVRLSRKTIRYRTDDIDGFVNGRVVASAAA